MAKVTVIGAGPGIRGYALAGATVLSVDDPTDVLDAWHTLPAEVALVLLTTETAAVLGDLLAERADVLTAVIPS